MQGQQEQALTFEQKVNILQNITLFPALTIMVFLRKKVGFRFLDLMKIQIMVVLLWAYGAFSSITFGPAAGSIIFLFSLAVLIAAIIERRIRWNEIKRGISWHTYSRGISWFSSFLPLSEIMVRRFVDPAAALIPGIVLFFLFRPLGLYIILSAVCLFLFETIDYQKQIDRMLDQLDNLVESEVVSENVEYFEHGGAARARPVEETAGIPTGTDPDLAAAIERRKRRSQQSQPLRSPSQYLPVTPSPQPETYALQPQTSPPPHYPQARQPQVQTSAAPPPQDFPPSTAEVEPDLADAVERRRARRQPQATPPLNTPSPQPPPSSQNSNQSQQRIPVIQSPNDPAFAALPSGAQFMTPDGKTRIKK